MKTQVFSPDKYKSLRKKTGLTNYRLAGEIGVPSRTVYDWEYGRCEPSFARGLVLAKALGVDPYDLLEGKD